MSRSAAEGAARRGLQDLLAAQRLPAAATKGNVWDPGPGRSTTRSAIYGFPVDSVIRDAAALAYDDPPS